MRNRNRWVDGGSVGWGPIVGLLMVLTAVHAVSAQPAVAGEFSVAITASPVVAEPGLSVLFSSTVWGGSPPLEYAWTSSSNLTGDGTNFTAWATEPGNLTVTLMVHDSAGMLAVASYLEPILDGVSIGVTAVNATDVGSPFSLGVTVSGGVAPYATELSLDGGGSLAETLPDAGTFAIPAWSSWTGPLNATGVVTDALGATARTDAMVAALSPRPEIALAGGPGEVEAGVRYTWWASVVGGTPPIQWNVTGAGAVGNLTGAPAAGSTPGTISWSGAFNASGNASVLFTATDAGRSVAALDLPVRVAPRVTALVSLPEGSSATSVNVTVLGGVPPYEILLSASDGESWAGNTSGPSTFTWVLNPRTPGQVNVTVLVVDAASGNSTATRSITGPIATIPVASSSGPDPIGILALVLVAVGGVAGAGVNWLLRRRRAEPPVAAPPTVPAIEEVRRILEESDSLERETVCLTAEERGCSRESVEAGIDHWVHQGRIEIVRGSGGEELLRWREESEPIPAERP